MSHPWSHPQGACTGVKTIAEKAERLQGVEMVSANCRTEHKSTSPSPSPLQGGGRSLWPPARGEGCSRTAMGISGPGRGSALEGLRSHPQEETSLTKQIRKMKSVHEQSTFCFPPRGEWPLGDGWYHALHLTDQAVLLGRSWNWNSVCIRHHQNWRCFSRKRNLSGKATFDCINLPGLHTQSGCLKGRKSTDLSRGSSSASQRCSKANYDCNSG